MRPAYCLFMDGPGVGPAVGVQDCFGRQFRRVWGMCKAGEIYSKALIHEPGSKRIALDEYGKSPSPFKVIGRVHVQTIYAVLRRAGRHGIKLASGPWYEVHGD